MGQNNCNIKFFEKHLTLKSIGGPYVTIIELLGSGKIIILLLSSYSSPRLSPSLTLGSGFIFDSPAQTNSIIDGFTIQHGFALYGGGMRYDKEKNLD